LNEHERSGITRKKTYRRRRRRRLDNLAIVQDIDFGRFVGRQSTGSMGRIRRRGSFPKLGFLRDCILLLFGRFFREVE
jgi:hypothetical protein